MRKWARQARTSRPFTTTKASLKNSSRKRRPTTATRRISFMMLSRTGARRNTESTAAALCVRFIPAAATRILTIRRAAQSLTIRRFQCSEKSLNFTTAKKFRFFSLRRRFPGSCATRTTAPRSRPALISHTKTGRSFRPRLLRTWIRTKSGRAPCRSCTQRSRPRTTKTESRQPSRFRNMYIRRMC